MPDHPDDQLQKLVSRLDQLERILQSQVQRIHALEIRLSLTSAGLPVEPPPVPVLERPQDLQDTGSEVLATPSYPTDSDTAAASVSSPRESLESKIGGNLLNKIGMVAIILGVGYFLKYAIDNEWIGEMGRVVIGILTGLGF